MGAISDGHAKLMDVDNNADPSPLSHWGKWRCVGESKVFEIMKRVNIKHQDDCQSLLLKMRDDGAVKFDIHKGHWLAS